VRRRWVALAAVWSWGVSASIGLSQSPTTNPWDYGLSLAQHDIPGGVVAPERVAGERRRVPPEAKSPKDKALFKERIAATLEAFNAEHAGFAAGQENGVIHIRSIEEPTPVSNALERRTTFSERATNVAVLDVMMKGVLGAMRGAEIRGWVGGGAEPGPECSPLRPVRVPGGSVTAVELLDEVVRQVPGLVWYVTYDSENLSQDVKVGLICSNGTIVNIEYP
jgi:hypothetical protein